MLFIFIFIIFFIHLGNTTNCIDCNVEMCEWAEWQHFCPGQGAGKNHHHLVSEDF